MLNLTKRRRSENAPVGCERLCFVLGHDFPGCGKTQVLYQGTTLVGPYTTENTLGFSP
jgi:hypothetical protein